MKMDKFIKTTIKNAIETAFSPETNTHDARVLFSTINNFLDTLEDNNVITYDEEIAYMAYKTQLIEAL